MAFCANQASAIFERPYVEAVISHLPAELQTRIREYQPPQ